MLLAVVAVVAVVVVAGVLAPAVWSGGSRSARPAAIEHATRTTAAVSASAPTTPTNGVEPTTTPALQAPVDPPTTPLTPALPTRVVVPKIGVDSSLQALGKLADGSLQSPSQWQQAGWYANGIRPGAVGPAVIAGHVDSVNGPAVFYRLKELVIGDVIEVDQAGGAVLHFDVVSVQRFAKNTFPTQAVYGPTALPELKLVTCTGAFDESKHSYVDNLVVTSVLAGSVLN
jgi:sortase (surface protein transpeptidase)